jgi:hypothetical protein
MIPIDDETFHRAIMAYRDLRKDGRVNQVYAEQGHIFMVPEGRLPLRSSAEFIAKHDFIALVDSLSPGVIITETSRKPVRSETSKFGSMELRRIK